MISLKTAITLILIHLIYYFILQMFSDFLRIGSVKNTPNKLITKLRSQYKVQIKTFQKNNDHLGFAWFKTIYLNESLFRSEKVLMATFYHELYHVQHKHKRNTLLLRFEFSLIPILLIFHWSIFLITYVLFAWLIYKANEYYERKANEYANLMTEKLKKK
jgi:hypothetical protein